MKEEINNCQTANQMWQVVSKYYNTDAKLNIAIKSTLIKGINTLITLLPKK